MLGAGTQDEAAKAVGNEEYITCYAAIIHQVLYGL